MKKEENQSGCESCKFFIRHFARINGLFVKIGCGHCSNNLLSPKKRRKCPYAKSCRGRMPVTDNL